MATRVKVEGTARLKRSLTRAFDRTIRDRGFLTRVGKVLTRNNKADVRQGLNPETGTPLPRLAPSTIATREYLAQFNRTGVLFDPSFGNATLTGQLLNSIKFEVVTRFLLQSFIELTVKDKRRSYKTGPNSRAKNTPTNTQIIGYLEKLDIQVLGISDKTEQIISAEFRRFLRRRLRSR